MDKKIHVFTFGEDASMEFEIGGALYGWSRWGLTERDRKEGRALYDALGLEYDANDYTLGKLENGDLALVGPALAGNKFAILRCGSDCDE